MNFLSLYENIRDSESNAFYLIESFLLQLLKIEAESNDQVIETEGQSSQHRFDAYAPNGFADIPGPL